MQNFKKFLKSIIPSAVLRPFLGPFHILQALAANLKYGFPARSIKVIGVTGTNGKTTTAIMIAKVLETAGYKVGLSTSALFQIDNKKWENDQNMTVINPFALQKLLKQMKLAGVEWAVLEITSHALSQHRVFGIPIHTAVITNLSPDHLDYHKTVQKYAAAKAKLLKKAKHSIILNRDDEWFNYFQKVSHTKTVTYGTSQEADIRLAKAILNTKGSKFEIVFDNQKQEFEIALPAKFNVYNALAAITVADSIGVGWDKISEGLNSITNIPGRFERIEAGQDFTVIVDYAHMPEAFNKFFESLKPLVTGKLIAVFGGSPVHDYAGLGTQAGKWADVAIVADDEPMKEDPESIRLSMVEAAQASAHAEVMEIADRKEAISQAFLMAKPNDTVALLCLGNQQYRRVKGGRLAWDDRQVAKELLKQLFSNPKS